MKKIKLPNEFVNEAEFKNINRAEHAIKLAIKDAEKKSRLKVNRDKPPVYDPKSLNKIMLSKVLGRGRLDREHEDAWDRLKKEYDLKESVNEADSDWPLENKKWEKLWNDSQTAPNTNTERKHMRWIVTNAKKYGLDPDRVDKLIGDWDGWAWKRHNGGFEGWMDGKLSESVTEAQIQDLSFKSLLGLGAKATVKLGEDKLLQLSDALDYIGSEQADDVASHLNMAIELIQEREPKEAQPHIKKFQKACKKALKELDESVTEAKESYKIMRLVKGRTKELIEGTIDEIMSRFSSVIDKLRDSGSGKQYKDDPKTIEELVKYLNAAQSYTEKKDKPKNTYEIQESVTEANDNKLNKEFVDDIYKAVGVIDKILSKNKPPKVSKDIWGKLYGLAGDITDKADELISNESVTEFFSGKVDKIAQKKFKKDWDHLSKSEKKWVSDEVRKKTESVTEGDKNGMLYYEVAKEVLKDQKIKLHTAHIESMLDKMESDGHLKYDAMYTKSAKKDIEAAIDKVGKKELKSYVYESVNEAKMDKEFAAIAASVKKHDLLMKISNELFPKIAKEQKDGELVNFKPLSQEQRDQVYSEFTKRVTDALKESVVTEAKGWNAVAKVMDAALKKAKVSLSYAKDYAKSLEGMAKRDAKQFFAEYGDMTEDDFIEDVEYNMRNESVTEAKFDKKKLMKAMKKDDGMITVDKGIQYIVYKYDNGNDDNDEMWQDDVIFALDQDGEEHEIKYSDIESYSESVVNESFVSFANSLNEKWNFSEAEVKAAAEQLAKAMANTDKVKVEVHDIEYDKGKGAGFELSWDGDKHDGGSYYIKDNGDVINAAISGGTKYGTITSTQRDFEKGIRATSKVRNESRVTEATEVRYKKGDKIEYQLTHKGGVGKYTDAMSKSKNTESGVIKKRIKGFGGTYKYLLTSGLELYASEIIGLWVRRDESAITERKIQTKRKYTENHPAKTVGKDARIRNKILEVLKDGKMNQASFDKLVKELSSDNKRWMKRNGKMFNVSEDGISLSRFGQKILKGIVVNESFKSFTDSLDE